MIKTSKYFGYSEGLDSIMNDKLLSQSDIDSMVSSLAMKEESKPKEETIATPNVMPSNSCQAIEETPAVPSVKAVSIQDALSNEKSQAPSPSPGLASPQTAKIIERLNRIEAKVQKLEQYERIKTGHDIAPVSPQQFQELINFVQKLNEDIRSISGKLQGTPGYDIYHSFNCNKCGTQQQLATVFKCTRCGHESWHGWWP